MKKIVLGGLLVVAVAGCGAPDAAAPAENTKSVSQQLVPTAPGWISAFAGNGFRGYSSSGTPSLSAQLDSPSGLALCPDGALYVSDTGNILFKGGQANLYVYAGNDPVNRIDPSGRFWWIVAGAAAGAAADAALQLYGNGGDFGKLDLGEIGTAAAVGALLPGLGAEIILGTAFSGVSTSGGLVAVTQWGGQASPWVMLGANTFRNYWLSGSPELGYARDDAQTLYVESSELSYPGGWQWIKGTWGQRICQ